MNLLKLITIILVLCSGFTYAQSDLDRYYSLEEEVAKLRAQFRDNQGLISEHNTTSNHFWSPSSTKKILARINKDQDRIKEMKPKIEEMRRLEQSLEVKAWTYRLGTLEQVDTILGNVSQNNTCSAQGQQLFTSDKAFGAWNAQNGDLDRKVAYYAQKNGYISNCLDEKKNGDKASIDESWSSLCKKVDWLPDTKFGDKKAYRLKKENGKIVLSANLYFKFKGDDKKRKEAFKRLQDAKPCMSNFYARHGIKLDLTFHEETGFKDWMSCDHSINLHTEYHRANADNWTTHNTLNTNLIEMNRCSIFLHELGHKLGLPDTYPAPDCPDRSPIGEPNDIMRISWPGADASKLNTTEIKSILAPLCGE